MNQFAEHSSFGLKALKYLVQPTRPITYGIVQCGPDFEDGVPYIRPVDMDDEQGIKSAVLLRTDPEIANSFKRSTIAGKDLVISIGPSFGKVMVVPDELAGANLTQGTARVAPTHTNCSRFVFWALRSSFCKSQWESSVSGATFRALNLGPLSETKLPVPPKEDQDAIADFLDKRTRKVDALAEKKRALIEKLKEKRSALISRTVTKGLPAEAAVQAGLSTRPKFRSSGLDWLGDIPEHWDLKGLRRLVTSIEQGWSPECSNANAELDEWGVVRAGCCKGGRFNSEDNKSLPPDLDPPLSLEIRAGDLLMSRASGSQELVGSVALVPSVTRGKLLLSDKTYRLKCDSLLAAPTFVARILQSSIGRLQIETVINGASGLAKNIAQSDVKNLQFPVPPLAEQTAIAAYLDRETAKIDRMIEKVEAALEKLAEYRTALITAAVTGKIDVRGAAA